MLYELYNGAVKIHFTESNHSYWLEDEEGKKRRLLGTTTAIGILDKPALIPWAVGVTVNYIKNNIARIQDDPAQLLKDAKEEANKQKDLAAEIGKKIHEWISFYIGGSEPEMPEDNQVLIGVNSFLDWVAEYDVKFKETEKLIYSREHNFVGTLDIIASIKDEDYLLDIKTGNAIYSEVRLQTAAYQRAYEEETGKKLKGRWVLRISKETEAEFNSRMEEKGKTGEYKIFEAVYLGDEDADDFEGFLNCLKLYRWKQQAKI